MITSSSEKLIAMTEYHASAAVSNARDSSTRPSTKRQSNTGFVSWILATMSVSRFYPQLALDDHFARCYLTYGVHDWQRNQVYGGILFYRTTGPMRLGVREDMI